MCPNDFYQLFTWHVLLVHSVLPLVYGLLIGKSTADYNEFFEKILERDNFEPTFIMIDFEQATIKSVKEKLPNVLQKGNTCTTN